MVDGGGMIDKKELPNTVGGSWVHDGQGQAHIYIYFLEPFLT